MNSFREIRSLRTLVIGFGVAVLSALAFLFIEKASRDAATERLTAASTELNRLQRLAPFPSEENLRKMKAHTENYATALGKLREELKPRVVPVTALKPNEFQSQLRVAIVSIRDKAHGQKVRLPDKFVLGFEEFVAALPYEPAAPLLGQELLQIEWIANVLLDARVEAITAFRRPPKRGERGDAAVAKSGPTAVVNKLERNVVELAFVSTPAAARRVINQIAGANQHFCIIRELQVRNEKPTGPPREATGEALSAVSAKSPSTSAPATSLNFIVGNEKIETRARIEILRSAF